MRRILRTFAFLFAGFGLLAAAPVPGKVGKVALGGDEGKRSYYLYVPESAAGAEAVPLIVLLHGSGRDGSALVDKWKKLAEQEKIILVGPNSFDSRGWASPLDGPRFLLEVAREIRKTYAVDPRRIYLFGHSAGARFALGMACLESRYFAAVSVHAGAFGSGEEASIMQAAKRKVPVQLIVGTRDPFFPLRMVTATGAAFSREGFPVEFEKMDGHDHDYYSVARSVNEKAWGFLKDKTLASEPLE